MAIATPQNTGGYDYKFIDAAHDRVICKICHLPSRDPYLSVCCGHVFCKSCLDKVKNASTIINDCPVCRDKEFVTFPNRQVDREVRGLHIYCTNKEKGCKWQGELNDINSHLGNSDGCQFEEVRCSNECGKMIERQYLTSHVETECPCRKFKCQYCHDTGEHQFIEGQHKEECPKFPLPCPNKCEVGSVPREDMEAHRKECPLEMIQCEYHSVGCEVRMARKEMEYHNNQRMDKHLMMTKNELTNTKVQLNDTKAQLDTAFKQINSLAVLINAQIFPNTTGIASNYFRPIIDAMTMMFKSTCPVVIKMVKYNERRIHTEWYSDSFYTHNKGYKMCLCVYAAGYGDGKGTHLSVSLFLMKGLHDDELTWPLRGKLGINLLNQISDSEHHSKTVTFDDNTPSGADKRVNIGDTSACGWGFSKYFSNEDLHKTTPTCQYLKDDCLFFQVTEL